mmetsp:Transcript_36948/g.92643  ORF Transcript_36948/g.92643 Transcript_36948/m.92643 type:complete len:419 (+) Transcript_36948:134-1390(+)
MVGKPDVAELQLTLCRSCSDTFPRPILVGLDHQKSQLLSTLKEVVLEGHSTATIVTGPRGSGKSALVKWAALRLCGQAFDLVFLHGSIHVTMQSAVKHMWSALCGITKGVTSEDADVLPVFLHPSRKGRRVVVVMDEFQMFAAQPRQTLIYRLLDIMQHPDVCLGVVGLTSDLNCVRLLEKRVRSRFSQRVVVATPPSSPADLAAVLLHALSLPTGGSAQPTLSPAFIAEFNTRVRAALDDPRLFAALGRMFDFQRCPRDYLAACRSAVTALTVDQPYLSAEALLEALDQITVENSTRLLLRDLPVLDVCLLVATRKVQDRMAAGAALPTFHMVWDEFLSLKDVWHNALVLHRDVNLQAFEHLVGLRLLHTHRRGRTALDLEYLEVSVAVDADVLVASLQQRADCPTLVGAWAGKWIE